MLSANSLMLNSVEVVVFFVQKFIAVKKGRTRTYVRELAASQIIFTMTLSRHKLHVGNGSEKHTHGQSVKGLK